VISNYTCISIRTPLKGNLNKCHTKLNKEYQICIHKTLLSLSLSTITTGFKCKEVFQSFNSDNIFVCRGVCIPNLFICVQNSNTVMNKTMLTCIYVYY